MGRERPERHTAVPPGPTEAFEVLLCHCHVVSDRTVRAVAQAGAVDVDAVTSLCGAGGECGGCVPAIEELLAEAALAVQDPQRLLQHQRQRRALSPSAAFAH